MSILDCRAAQGAGPIFFGRTIPLHFHRRRIQIICLVGRLWLPAGAAQASSNSIVFCHRGPLFREAASQVFPEDGRMVLRDHLAQAAVAHDESPVDDIALAVFHIQVDADTHCIADGKMQQCPVGAVAADLVWPQGGIEEPGSWREEVLQEERPNGGVADEIC